MSAVDHLEELRARLIVSLLALGVAFGLCFWQNHQLLRLGMRVADHALTGLVGDPAHQHLVAADRVHLHALV